MACLLALTLCAGTAAARDIDERLWIKMESENFSVYSSVNRRKTRDFLVHLETLRSVFVNYLGYGVNLNEKPTMILVVGRQSDYRDLGLSMDTVGRFSSNLRNNIIIIRNAARMDETQVILHEYIHFLVRATDRFPFPLWWDEGYAEFASATRLTDSTFDMGLPLVPRVNTLNGSTWIPWEEVIAATSYGDFDRYRRSTFYAQAWLLVHFLQTRGSGIPLDESWIEYARQLSMGANQVEAFTAAFGLSIDELERQLDQYAGAGRLQYWRLPREALGVEVETVVDGVRPREIQVQLGRFALANGDEAAARNWFEKAIAGRSKDPAAFSGRATALAELGYLEEARSGFEQAREMDPANVLTLVDYARFEIENFARDDAPLAADEYLDAAEVLLTEARTLSGGSVEIDTYLAYVWLSRDAASVPAMQLLESVVERSPSDLWPALMLAETLNRNGRTEDALDLARAVIRYDHGLSGYSERARELVRSIQAERIRNRPDPPPSTEQESPAVEEGD